MNITMATSPVEKEVMVLIESPEVDLMASTDLFPITEELNDIFPTKINIFGNIQTSESNLKDIRIESAASVHAAVVSGYHSILIRLNKINSQTTMPHLNYVLSHI